MKIKIASLMVIGIVASTIAMAANIYCVANNTMKIGINDVRFTNDLLMVDDKLYVPIRELSEKLRIPVLWDEEKEQVRLSTDYKTIRVSEGTELKEEGVLPDDETALLVGKTILEKYVGKPLEYETEKGIYYMDVKYHKRDNTWRVYQKCKYKIGGGAEQAFTHRRLC